VTTAPWRRCCNRATGFHLVTRWRRGPQRAEYKRLIGGCGCWLPKRMHASIAGPVHPVPTALVPTPRPRLSAAWPMPLDGRPERMVILRDSALYPYQLPKPHFTSLWQSRQPEPFLPLAAQPLGAASAGPGQPFNRTWGAAAAGRPLMNILIVTPELPWPPDAGAVAAPVRHPASPTGRPRCSGIVLTRADRNLHALAAELEARLPARAGDPGRAGRAAAAARPPAADLRLALGCPGVRQWMRRRRKPPAGAGGLPPAREAPTNPFVPLPIE